MKKKKQKTKEKLSPMRRKISAMLTLQTFFVVLIVIVIATALALMYRIVITDMHMIGVLSMLVPIVVLVTLVNFLFTRYIYRYLDKISDAMQKVADGDYTVRLDALRYGAAAGGCKRPRATAQDKFPEKFTFRILSLQKKSLTLPPSRVKKLLIHQALSSGAPARHYPEVIPKLLNCRQM